MNATVVLGSPEGAGHGRHAAPLSAYGPADVHRLLPPWPAGSLREEPPASTDAPVKAADRAAAPAEDAAVTGGREHAEAPTKVTGFWARLRLLPAAV